MRFLQARLQTTLWSLVSTMVVSRLPAPAGHKRRNAILAEQCLVRHLPFQEVGQKWRDTVSKLLALLNGDWRQKRLIHHCSPECFCTSEDDSKLAVYSVLMEAGAVLGSDTWVPSINRWGATTQTAGLVAFFILCHQILPQCFSDTFKDLRKNDAGAAEGGDENPHRAIIRSKAWRSRCISLDMGRLRHIYVSAFVSVPIDSLMSSLQYLDSVGKCLLDNVWPVGSPIIMCQQRLTKMVAEPKASGSELLYLLDHFCDEKTQEEAVNMALNTAGLFGRRSFRDYHTPMYQTSRGIRPSPHVFHRWPMPCARMVSPPAQEHCPSG